MILLYLIEGFFLDGSLTLIQTTFSAFDIHRAHTNHLFFWLKLDTLNE